VRFEIRTALERGVRVIPVLADGAKPLQHPQLPPDLRKLARLSTLELSYDRFEYDETRLTAVIRKVLAVNSTPLTITLSAGRTSTDPLILRQESVLARVRRGSPPVAAGLLPFVSAPSARYSCTRCARS
jgi:hypothetical protein